MLNFFPFSRALLLNCAPNGLAGRRARFSGLEPPQAYLFHVLSRLPLGTGNAFTAVFTHQLHLHVLSPIIASSL